MTPAILGALLWKRARLARRDHWTRPAVLGWQASQLEKLRTFANTRSRFYQRFHRGFDGRPLGELPVLTKAVLMEEFDSLVTVPGLTLASVEAHLRTMVEPVPMRGGFYVASTSGTTGRRGVFVWGRSEWTTVLASFTRGNDWGRVRVGLTHRLSLAVVSSGQPWHQSAVAAASLQSPLVSTLRLDSGEPLEAICRRLDAFQPESLVAYASMSRILAEEQLAGRLQIHPVAVFSASEVLTDETRRRIREAWGIEPFNVFAATETAGIASECTRHEGLHLYEDLVIPEVVDDHNRPVPVGEFGAKLLVTVLFSRTQPLIRYELSDSVRLTSRVCSCGRPFALLEAIQGRHEDVLTLPRTGGGTGPLHPIVLHRPLEGAPVSGWQVRWDGARLAVLLAQVRNPFDDVALARRLGDELATRGFVSPPITVERVDAIPRTRAGKAPLVVSEAPSKTLGESVPGAPREPPVPT